MLLYEIYADHRDLHSFPTRRSSDLLNKDLEVYKIQLDQQKKDKDSLLSLTKNDEAKYQGLISQLKAEVASITDRKSTRLNSSHPSISYAVFCLKKKIKNT